jgi:hypothetical protein
MDVAAKAFFDSRIPLCEFRQQEVEIWKLRHLAGGS